MLATSYFKFLPNSSLVGNSFLWARQRPNSLKLAKNGKLNCRYKNFLTCFWFFLRSFSTTEQKKEAVVQDVSRLHAKVVRTARVKMDRTTKRFYKTVSVEVTPTGWVIKLDNYKVLSAQDHVVNVPSQELAFAVAAEWECQHTVIDLYRMPLFHLASTATDITLEDVEHYNKQIMEIFENDDFCVRDSLKTSTLGIEQREHHQAFVDWFERHFKLPLSVGIHNENFHQPQKTRTFLEAAVSQLDDWTLTGLHALTSRLQSFVGALAVWNYEFSVQQVIDAALIEQIISEKKHGFIPGEHDIERALFFNEVTAASLFLHLLPSTPINRQTLELFQKK